jgi:hypothetical protein
MVAAVNENLDLQLTSLARAAKKANSLDPNFQTGPGALAKAAAWIKQHTLDVKAYTDALVKANSALNQAIAAIQSSSFAITFGGLKAEGTKTLVDDIANAAARVKEAEDNLAKAQATKSGPAHDRLVEEATLELQRRRNELQAKKDQAAAESTQTQNEADQKRKDAATLLASTAKAAIDLQNARFDTREAIAKGTKGIKDDRQVALDRIAYNRNVVIAGLVKERDALDKTAANYKLRYREISAEIQGVITKNVVLRQGIKDLTNPSGGGGFSLADLFKESLRQFQEFGSNVSSNPLTGGQVRGQFAGTLISTIMGSQKDRAALGIISVASNTSETNLLLRQLIALVKGEPIPSGTGTITSISVGRKTADSGRLLHRNVGHL